MSVFRSHAIKPFVAALILAAAVVHATPARQYLSSAFTCQGHSFDKNIAPGTVWRQEDRSEYDTSPYCQQNRDGDKGNTVMSVDDDYYLVSPDYTTADGQTWSIYVPCWSSSKRAEEDCCTELAVTTGAVDGC